MRGVFGFIGAVLLAMPAFAQELPGRREALRMIHEADAEVEGIVIPHESLNEAEVALLASAIQQGLMPQMVFYGALAIAPDQGLADPQTTTAVGNFHDVESASAAALDRCNEARDEDSAECVVVLILQPAAWEAGAGLQLSSGAAEVLRGEFRRIGRPRVFAVSRATGQFGIGPSLETAMAACAATDCRPVIADD